MDAKNNTAPEIVTSIRLTRDQHARLKALASREFRSVSQEVRRVIERHLDEQPEERAA